MSLQWARGPNVWEPTVSFIISSIVLSFDIIFVFIWYDNCYHFISYLSSFDFIFVIIWFHICHDQSGNACPWKIDGCSEPGGWSLMPQEVTVSLLMTPWCQTSIAQCQFWPRTKKQLFFSNLRTVFVAVTRICPLLLQHLGGPQTFCAAGLSD